MGQRLAAQAAPCCAGSPSAGPLHQLGFVKTCLQDNCEMPKGKVVPCKVSSWWLICGPRGPTRRAWAIPVMQMAPKHPIRSFLISPDKRV